MKGIDNDQNDGIRKIFHFEPHLRLYEAHLKISFTYSILFHFNSFS